MKCDTAGVISMAALINVHAYPFSFPITYQRHDDLKIGTGTVQVCGRQNFIVENANGMVDIAGQRCIAREAFEAKLEFQENNKVRGTIEAKGAELVVEPNRPSGFLESAHRASTVQSFSKSKTTEQEDPHPR